MLLSPDCCREWDSPRALHRLWQSELGFWLSQLWGTLFSGLRPLAWWCSGSFPVRSTCKTAFGVRTNGAWAIWASAFTARTDYVSICMTRIATIERHHFGYLTARIKVPVP